jgi:hypothetical protein
MWLDLPAALVVVAFYGLNPGLLYMATTAMTEPLFLAEMIWALLLIVQFQRALSSPEQTESAAKPHRWLIAAGLVLVAAIFTRYDGWVYAAAAWIFATWPMLSRRPNWRGPVAGAWVLFTALLIAAPALWLAYNARQFGDPLDFMRGPFSARAIEAKTSPPGSTPHPGFHNLRNAAIYFFKAAQLGAVPLSLGKILCLLSFAGTFVALWIFRRRQIWPVLLLWLPLPFYAYSVAYGSVPIFIPIWQPYSWYNTRYGMEMLPAFALFAGSLVPLLLIGREKARRAALVVMALLIAANGVWLMRSRPLVFQEAVANSRSRLAFEGALTKTLLEIPGHGLILMRVSNDVGALQQSGIPLRRIINEGDYLTWQRALRNPAGSASTVIAFDGDVVAEAVQKHPDGLQIMNVICSTGQPCAKIYKSNLR